MVLKNTLKIVVTLFLPRILLLLGFRSLPQKLSKKWKTTILLLLLLIHALEELFIKFLGAVLSKNTKKYKKNSKNKLKAITMPLKELTPLMYP